MYIMFHRAPLRLKSHALWAFADANFLAFLRAVERFHVQFIHPKFFGPEI